MTSSKMNPQEGQNYAQTWSKIVTEGQTQFKPPSNQPNPQFGTPHRSHIEIPAPGSKKKLRESCNNCALSKVKCSKDQPVCVRCHDRGLFCRYSLSRRTGKRGPASRSSSTSSNSPSMSVNLDSAPPLDNEPWFDFQDTGCSLPKNSRAFDFSGSEEFFRDISPKRSCTPPNKLPSFNFQHSGHNSMPCISTGYKFFDVSRGESVPQSISPKRSKPSGPRIKTGYSDFEPLHVFDDNMMSWNDNFCPVNLNGPGINGSTFDCSMGSSAESSSPRYFNIDMTPTATSFDNMASVLGIAGPEATTSIAMTPSTSLSSDQSNTRYQQTLSPSITIEPVTLQSPLQQLQQSSLDCFTLALATLQSLHNPVSSCNSFHFQSSASSQPTQTIDSVLRRNKSIIDSLSTIISCSCSFDTDTSLLLTVMVSKVILSYRAAVASDAQLVLSELQHMVRLVEQLGRRLKDSSNAKLEDRTCIGGDGEDAWSGEGGGSVNNMAGLETFLRGRIREVMEEIIYMIRER